MHPQSTDCEGDALTTTLSRRSINPDPDVFSVASIGFQLHKFGKFSVASIAVMHVNFIQTIRNAWKFYVGNTEMQLSILIWIGRRMFATS